MAKKNLQQALDSVEITYSELIDTANEMITEYFSSANQVVSRLQNVQNLSTDDIRNAILEISLQAFSLSEVKEKSTLKAACAEALRKEAYAQSYSLAEGTTGAKDTFATLETATEVVTEALYELIANLFKTKLDELHRIVDALKSVLMSRMQEAKLVQGGISASSEIPGTTKMILNE